MLICGAPYIFEGASVVGPKEGEGPLGKLFDVIEQDPMLGSKSWEEAESLLQKETVQKLLLKSGLKKEDIRYIFAGDLLGQLIATTFGIMVMKSHLWDYMVHVQLWAKD